MVYFDIFYCAIIKQNCHKFHGREIYGNFHFIIISNIKVRELFVLKKIV